MKRGRELTDDFLAVEHVADLEWLLWCGHGRRGGSPGIARILNLDVVLIFGFRHCCLLMRGNSKNDEAVIGEEGMEERKKTKERNG